ncbi:MAG: hypothetical protein V8R75_00525 [Oscillospiraceae bacterium]
MALSIEDSGGGEIIWFASSVFLEDLYNAYSSGANVNRHECPFLSGGRK